MATFLFVRFNFLIFKLSVEPVNFHFVRNKCITTASDIAHNIADSTNQATA